MTIIQSGWSIVQISSAGHNRRRQVVVATQDTTDQRSSMIGSAGRRGRLTNRHKTPPISNCQWSDQRVAVGRGRSVVSTKTSKALRLWYGDSMWTIDRVQLINSPDHVGGSQIDGYRNQCYQRGDGNGDQWLSKDRRLCWQTNGSRRIDLSLSENPKGKGLHIRHTCDLMGWTRWRYKLFFINFQVRSKAIFNGFWCIFVI